MLDRDLYNGTIKNIAHHPIITYIMVEIHLGLLNQISLNEIPRIAISTSIPNKTHPFTPFKDIKQNGAYEPAIKIKIIEWSNLLKNLIVSSFAITKWYVADAEYNSINDIPNIITAVRARGDGFSNVVFITNINKPANDKIAPNKWVNPFIGYLIYLPIFITVTENL